MNYQFSVAKPLCAGREEEECVAQWGRPLWKRFEKGFAWNSAQLSALLTWINIVQ